MLKGITLISALVLCTITTFAQTYNITGRVLDAKDTSSLIGVTVVLTKAVDTTSKTGTATDASGNFELDGVSPGRYSLQLVYLGYTTVTRTITVATANIALNTITMSASKNELKAVQIEGKQVRADQMGDTTQFHADAYKTNPDATAEDLVTKMPGVTSDNSGVKVNGENVQQVYVDGKPFFGTDPTLALKNLPAEVIDKIQVFDKLSDQATFTGFDDGNSQKTMNIITKKNKSEGQFGKIFGGYGTDDRYLAGGSFNSFDGDRRISIIELSNNVNQQNFSSQDILGITGSGGGGGRGGGGGGGAFGGGSGGGNASNNFLTGQQNGITTTHSVGFNYSDQWGKKVKITGSYFFNYTDNSNSTQLTRNYFGDTLLSAYNESDNSESRNFNHRFNIRLEYTIDSFNSIIFTPSASLQQNYATTNQVDSSFSPTSLTSRSINNTIANNAGYTSSDNLLLQHKFHKKGRTISLNLTTSLNEKSGDGSIMTTNTSYGAIDSTSLLDQHYNLYNNSHTFSSNLTYTEPIGKQGQLSFNYSPSITKSHSDKETDTLNSLGIASFDTTLSNKYNSTYTTQRGGISYRISDKKLNFMVGVNYQYSELEGTQTFPSSLAIYRPFSNVLPISFFNYKFKDGRNLRIMYRTNITAPGITQLQNVVDVSNPLLLSTGNPNLKQDYEQTLTIRYSLTKSKTAHNFFLYAYANYVNDYIGTATFTTARPDSVIANGILLKRGDQLTLPVNLNYYSNNKLFITYSMPADFIKSNFNLNGGIAYTRTPGEINYATDYSNNIVPSLGVVLSSNVSENLDFTLSYSGSYNFIQNSIQTQANNNYYNHVVSFKINWIFLKGFVFNTNITNSYYSVLSSSSGNINYYLWNAYVGYKFFKNHSLEARISAFDLLNQNKSVTRTVTGTYVENDITNVLKQYFMFQLTYTLRNFKGAAPAQESNPDKPAFPDGVPGGPGGQRWQGGSGNGNGYGH